MNEFLSAAFLVWVALIFCAACLLFVRWVFARRDRKRIERMWERMARFADSCRPMTEWEARAAERALEQEMRS